MRITRLKADKDAMFLFASQWPLVEVDFDGNPPERYIVILRVKGLAKDAGIREPRVINEHMFEIYLHNDYPRLPPAINWLTNIFHPNIMPAQKNGGVCIGGWTAAMSIPELCIKIADMIQYKSYNTIDPLNESAGRWAEINSHLFPIGDATWVYDG